MISVVGSGVGPSGCTVGVCVGVWVGGDVGSGVQVEVGAGVEEGMRVEVGVKVRVRVGVGVGRGASGSGLASTQSMTTAIRTTTASPRNTQGLTRRIVARIVPYAPLAGKQARGLSFYTSRPRVLILSILRERKESGVGRASRDQPHALTRVGDRDSIKTRRDWESASSQQWTFRK
jgi:hypothetical protein